MKRVPPRFEHVLPVMMVFVSGVSGDCAKKQRATKQLPGSPARKCWPDALHLARLLDRFSNLCCHSRTSNELAPRGKFLSDRLEEILRINFRTYPWPRRTAAGDWRIPDAAWPVAGVLIDVSFIGGPRATRHRALSICSDQARIKPRSGSQVSDPSVA